MIGLINTLDLNAKIIENYHHMNILITPGIKKSTKTLFFAILF